MAGLLLCSVQILGRACDFIRQSREMIRDLLIHLFLLRVSGQACDQCAFSSILANHI